MEDPASLLLRCVLCVIVLRLIWKPARHLLRLGGQCACAVVCLLLINSVSGFTGLLIPVNAVTVLLCGTLGFPGLALAALLEIL